MKKDQVRIGAEVEPGARLVERRIGDQRALGVLAPLKDGQPLQEGAEVVKITRGQDEWHDVEVLYRSGPPQVATPAYREGYDRIFGKKPSVGVA